MLTYTLRSDLDDERPPQSASRDLLAVTLVSPTRKDQLTDWTTPSIRSEPRKDGTLRIGSPQRLGSPQRAVSPTEALRSRTTPALPTFGYVIEFLGFLSGVSH